jgi:hypothetical protein
MRKLNGHKEQKLSMCKKEGITQSISTLLQMGNIEKEDFSIRTRRRTIVGENNLKVFITENYKKLFGAPAKNNFTLREDLVADIPQLTQEENDILIAGV